MVLFEELTAKQGAIGLMTLNRPQALNAINLEMYILMEEKLKAWQFDNNIKAVVIQGAGDRAFCAGGDVRVFYENRHKPVSELIEFFRREYRFNYQVFNFPKPYIALLDGITMGGGVGVSIHGSHRVATERLKFAMPETGIGLYPDIGGSYFLPRCPGRLGWYLGLSGEIIDAADALYAELIDYQIPSQQLPQLLQTLAKADFAKDPHLVVDDILEQFAVALEPAKLSQHRAIIDKCFSHHSIEDIFKALAETDNEWCHRLLASLQTKCPTSLKVTLRELAKGAKLDFANCMRMEYRLTFHCLQNVNFYEGVRAAVVDKDKKPHWQPNELAKITEAEVDKYFEPLSMQELHFN